MSKKEDQLYLLVDMYNPYRVIEEVNNILLLIEANHNLDIINMAFKDILDLFIGKYPGFKACNCTYHDLMHTTDVFLAMARLIHGAVIRGYKFTDKEIDLGLLSALLHDTGFIQKKGDDKGTGAKYTLVHIDRSIEFANDYLPKIGFSDDEILFVASILRCTGVKIKISDVNFFSKEHEILGKMLGTADLMGQMASRIYLEKLPYLYNEFKEGNVHRYKDEFDLIKKTIYFYEWTFQKFKNEFDSVYKFARQHFKERWGIDNNLYLVSVEKNISYLEQILNESPHKYRTHLRRRLLSFQENYN